MRASAQSGRKTMNAEENPARERQSPHNCTASSLERKKIAFVSGNSARNNAIRFYWKFDQIPAVNVTIEGLAIRRCGCSSDENDMRRRRRAAPRRKLKVQFMVSFLLFVALCHFAAAVDISLRLSFLRPARKRTKTRPSRE